MFSEILRLKDTLNFGAKLSCHNVEQEMPKKYQVPYIPDHGICKLQRAIRRQLLSVHVVGV